MDSVKSAFFWVIAVTLHARWQRVRTRIEHAARSAGRNDAVSLLAVSKRQPAAAVREMHGFGQMDFGESYLQEALAKMAELADSPDVCWHFIGPLQSNKCKGIAQHFHWVHSVDRLKVLQQLDAHRAGHPEPLNILLQLKIGDEASKSGVAAQDFAALAARASECSNLRLRGLMCIPPPSDDVQRQRAQFSLAADVFAAHAGRAGFDVLSMGMSGDLEAAIACGATLVRVGTDLFGSRL